MMEDSKEALAKAASAFIWWTIIKQVAGLALGLAAFIYVLSIVIAEPH